MPWPEDPPDARARAERAFKAATTKKAELPPQTPSVPGVMELVSLRIDREMLDFFQADGPAGRSASIKRCARRRGSDS